MFVTSYCKSKIPDTFLQHVGPDGVGEEARFTRHVRHLEHLSDETRAKKQHQEANCGRFNFRTKRSAQDRSAQIKCSTGGVYRGGVRWSYTPPCQMCQTGCLSVKSRAQKSASRCQNLAEKIIDMWPASWTLETPFLYGSKVRFCSLISISRSLRSFVE